MGNDMFSALQVHYRVPQGSLRTNTFQDICEWPFGRKKRLFPNSVCRRHSVPSKWHYWLSATSNTQHYTTQQTLTKIKQYFNKNGLLLNSMKTQYIFIGSRAFITKIPGNTTIRAGETFIHPIRSVNILVLHFDNYMSFDVLVTKMSKKVSDTLMYINHIQDLLSKEARLTAVETLALGHIHYGITFWSTANITQLKRVQNYKTFLPKWPLAEPPNLIMPLQFSTNCNGSPSDRKSSTSSA